MTGFYCSGKSEVEKILTKSFGFYSIDVDKIGHWALEKKKKELVSILGKTILGKNKINRKMLGEIVFNDNVKLSKLNSIVHSVMTNKIKQEIKKNKKKICINAALLFDMNLDKLCNKIIVVKAGLFKILSRAKKRDGSSIFRTLKILNHQRNLKKIRKNNNIILLKNHGSIKMLQIQIKKLI